jgi:hypothetical protein
MDKFGHHILFSVDNPLHGQHNPAAHDSMINTLKSNNVYFEEVEGKYSGAKERSIMVHNPDMKMHKAIEKILKDQGQESYIVSDGQKHKMKFLNGPHEGKFHQGSGTIFHQFEPEDGFSKTKSGKIFTHNFDFSNLYK